MKSEENWPGGWLVAALAGVIAAILAGSIGDVGILAALLVAVFVFLVFGVLLGLFWGAPLAGSGESHGHKHDHAPPAHATLVASAKTLQGLTPVAPVAPVVAEEPMPVAALLAPAESLAALEALEPLEPLPEMETLPETEPLPMAEPLQMAEPLPMPALGEGQKPQGLAAARDGKGDNLQTIEGIGPVLEKLCHELGIFHFDQIAAWGPAQVAWMDANLKGFRGRVTRDKWLAQAQLIGEIGVAAFLIRAKTNDY